MHVFIKKWKIRNFVRPWSLSRRISRHPDARIKFGRKFLHQEGFPPSGKPYFMQIPDIAIRSILKRYAMCLLRACCWYFQVSRIRPKKIFFKFFYAALWICYEHRCEQGKSVIFRFDSTRFWKFGPKDPQKRHFFDFPFNSISVQVHSIFNLFSHQYSNSGSLKTILNRTELKCFILGHFSLIFVGMGSDPTYILGYQALTK